jgi:hypothetical protein
MGVVDTFGQYDVVSILMKQSLAFKARDAKIIDCSSLFQSSFLSPKIQGVLWHPQHLRYPQH